MGEDDIVSGNSVQDQPAWGILFKSHNNTGWAISPMEDLKFTVKCASFELHLLELVHLQMMMFQLQH